MKRIQAFEFNDQSWLPAVLRDLFNDAIGFTHWLYGPYQRTAQPIAEWASRGKATTLLDLASAGGEHVETIIRAAKRQKLTLPKIILSDLFPVPATWKAVQQQWGEDAVGMIEAPVSALEVPKNAPRYWMLFTALHHFPPSMAQAFLKRFTEQADGLCIGEYLHRSWYNVLMVVLALPVNFFMPFFAKRITFGKIFWNSVIPVGLLLCMFDGVVSALRTYRPEEIIAMLPAETRDQFVVEHQEIWYGRVPMKSTLIFITRRSVLR